MLVFLLLLLGAIVLGGVLYLLIQVGGLVIVLSALFIGHCAAEAGKLALQLCWWALATGLPLLWTGARNAVLFFVILWDEMRADRGTGDHQENSAGDNGHDHKLAAALRLLGLRPGCTAGDLNSAYKRAIRAAHPDAGGNAAETATINAARDVITRAMDRG